MGIADALTMETTFMVLLPNDHRHPERDEWHFTSQAEYTAVTDITDWLAHAYDGSFADPSMHRIVEVSRRVMDPEEYQ